MNECTLLNNIMMTEGREEEEGKKNVRSWLVM